MTNDFLIGAIRASRDLHPQVKTELEEILYRAEPVAPVVKRLSINRYVSDYECPECANDLSYPQNYCSECGKPVKWE